MANLTAMALLALLLLSLALPAASVDKSKFRKCDQSGFCRRNRALAASLPVASPACAQALPAGPRGVSGTLRTPAGTDAVVSVAPSHVPGVLRVRVAEAKQPGRYPGPLEALLPETATPAANVTAVGQSLTLEFDAGGGLHAVAAVSLCPFSIDVSLAGGKGLKMTANARGLLVLEHRRASRDADAIPSRVADPAASRPDIWDDELDGTWEAPTIDNPAMSGRWEEEFGGHKDPKPFGPQDTALDVRFHGDGVNLYGLPEHAGPLALRRTRGNGISEDPYRLWNADVFEYEVSGAESMGLYGSIPLIVAHAPKVGSAAVLWLNAAETWVDISDTPSGRGTDVHWMSESGAVDAFFFVGPTPSDVFKQVTAVLGRAQLPPVFSLAYHQCKWNYKTQAEVAEVDSGFDAANIPYDVLWLDIEHTDSKKYFTWDKSKFPNPEGMMTQLAQKGRRTVTIVDPHIKNDHSYHIHASAEQEKLHVKDTKGETYKGKCWPGDSSWIDFLNPRARAWWVEQYQKYPDVTTSLHTWNDMNEPSVFEGPETTLPREVIHHGGYEHRDVHNAYGFFMTMASYDAMVKRGKSELRPFILTRSFFAGSQRHAAVWTGDNKADWSHLAIAQPMLMSISVSGIPIVGSDIGGFFGNPEPELLTRWYQAAAWHPFFRSHAHLDSRRREPFLYSDPHLPVMREAILTRYRFLPYWYTLAYQHTQTGMPIMRPLWVEFPEDEECVTEQGAFMIGPSVLVSPVTSQGVRTQKIRFPGRKPWYDSVTGDKITAMTVTSVAAPLEKAPVFFRGGSIIPTRQRVRRSSDAMRFDPYTLIISLDAKAEARGVLYVDDGTTFAYKNGAFVERSFVFSENTLRATDAAGDSTKLPEAFRAIKIERLVVNGLRACPGSAVAPGDRQLRVTCNSNGQTVVHNVNTPALDNLEISLRP